MADAPSGVAHARKLDAPCEAIVALADALVAEGVAGLGALDLLVLLFAAVVTEGIIDAPALLHTDRRAVVEMELGRRCALTVAIRIAAQIRSRREVDVAQAKTSVGDRIGTFTGRALAAMDVSDQGRTSVAVADIAVLAHRTIDRAETRQAGQREPRIGGRTDGINRNISASRQAARLAGHRSLAVSMLAVLVRPSGRPSCMQEETEIIFVQKGVRAWIASGGYGAQLSDAVECARVAGVDPVANISDIPCPVTVRNDEAETNRSYGNRTSAESL